MRPDASRLLARRNDARSAERVTAHYDLELRLAERLRSADAADRPRVYGEVYAELFDSLEDHPQKTVREDDRGQGIARQIANIRDQLTKDAVFLEVGCGDARMSFAVSPLVARTYGMDVTDSLVEPADAPANFTCILTDGVHVPLADASVDIAFSNQLMEHLHPEDARAQLREIARVLKPGGSYFICTPSRMTGPHDISRYFDYEAKGLHLREYDYRTLDALLREAGFRKRSYRIGKSGWLVPVPAVIPLTAERLFASLPLGIRGRIADNRLATGLFGIHALATK